jgi:hypothetical protein
LSGIGGGRETLIPAKIQSQRPARRNAFAGGKTPGGGTRGGETTDFKYVLQK